MKLYKVIYPKKAPKFNLAFWFGLFIPLVVIYFTFSTNFPRLHDYTEWVYQAWAYFETITDKTGSERYYLYPYPVPNGSLLIFLLNIIAIATTWILSSKIVILLYIVLFYLVLYRLVHHWNIEHKQLSILLGLILLVFPTTYWNGFMSYQLSLLIFIGFLGYHSRTTPLLLIAFFCVLAFFAHAAGLLLMMLFVVLQIIIDKFPKKQLLGFIPVGILIGWYMYGRYTESVPLDRADASIESWMEFIQLKGYILARCGPYRTFILANGQSTLESFGAIHKLGWVTNFAHAIFMIIIILISSLSLLKRTLVNSELPIKTIQLSAILILILHLILPYNFLGILNLGERLFLPIMVLLLFSFDLFSRKYNVKRFVSYYATFFMLLTLIQYGLAVSDVEEPIKINKRERLGKSNLSVTEFNKQSYSKTKQKYFNHRIFAFENKLVFLINKKHVPVSFRTGPMRNKNQKQQK